VLFHRKRLPREVGHTGIIPFINHLAVAGNVAASTQSQALNAVLLYRDVLEIEVGTLPGLQRIKHDFNHGRGYAPLPGARFIGSIRIDAHFTARNLRSTRGPAARFSG